MIENHLNNLEISSFLKVNAQNGFIPWSAQGEAARRFNLTLAEVEEIILGLSLMPLRYRRNTNTFNHRQQLAFLKSRVSVIGCGGLGGYVIDGLARLGIGQITAIDPDVFEETNLNRQLNSSFSNLGKSKAKIAAKRAGEINPAVKCVPRILRFSKTNGQELLQGSSVAVDALDNIPARLEAAWVCNRMGIPLVHGAIAGWYGQVTVQYPGEDTIERIYAGGEEAVGAEKNLGNPAFTPALVAGLEVSEVCKILIQKASPLKGILIVIDLLDMGFHKISI